MRNDNEQLSFENTEADKGPVVCLGMTFENDEARREYFRSELRKRLPELKKIEGFPIGDDEDILALSDPPYYTACPNPWLGEMVSTWSKEKKQQNYTVNEPLAVDISEGKNDPIYTAHTYHTKVPYKAIMQYMLYYTNPGDIVYDGFCGTGMTGVAAEKCGDTDTVKELLGEDFSEDKVGQRNAVLIDLAPAASFIAKNHSKHVEVGYVSKRLEGLIGDLKNKFEWTFATLGIDKSENTSNFIDYYTQNESYFGKINYIIWSEVYICPSCTKEFNFWEASVDETGVKEKQKTLACPHCEAKFDKRKLEKVMVSRFDYVINEVSNLPKTIPVRINYTYKGKRYNKKPDWYDYAVIDWFEKYSDFKRIGKFPFKNGIKTSEPIRNGLTHFHQVYTLRNLGILDDFCSSYSYTDVDSEGAFLLGSAISRLTKFNRYMPQHNRHVGPMANALYLPPLSVEINPMSQLELQLSKLVNAWRENQYSGNVISTQSSTDVKIPDNSVDYIFIDPPFGSNIMYSELSFIREGWLRIFTNDKKEAIENKSQGKTLNEYTDLMRESFKEAYRILKPNRWITVEFSNTQASVWNALQFVIENAGFVIASVQALDKKRGGFHALITTTAVKQDLVISAYKPSEEGIKKMKAEVNTEESTWTFISQHLSKLPVFVGTRGKAEFIVERDPRILFDRMIAYHVQNGLPVSISSVEFQEKLPRKFAERDGMIFLESQVAEYDKKRILAGEFSQLALFVQDEHSAIEWLRQHLMKKPQTRQDLHPYYMKEIQHISKHELLPELDDLLHQNFLRYEGEGNVPDQIISYLRRTYKDSRGLEANNPSVIEKAMNRWYVPDPNKQADLEKLREKSLLREFDSYLDELEGNKKKLKQFRTEAIRAGFMKAYSEKDFEKIVKVGDRLPESVIQEDDKLLMYYDNACIRLGL